MGILDKITSRFKRSSTPAASTPTLPGESEKIARPAGMTTTPEQRLRLLYQSFEPDFEHRQTVLDIREMDKCDQRVKRIHGRTARAAAKGGLILDAEPGSKLHQYWEAFARKLHLHRPAKLESDIRALVMEGNLAMEWIPDKDKRQIVGCQRLPSDTIKALVHSNGQFQDAGHAYEQWDTATSKAIAHFPLWQLTVGRLQPDNYDNWACFGRPYLDASRSNWRKLCMTETDLVIRRHTRAAQRLAHSLEGASTEQLKEYEDRIYSEQGDLRNDFFANKKLAVQPVAGDANLDQIKDVIHLLDTFFTGAPGPKALFGYADDVSRDVLEDLMRQFYDELDSLQDETAFVYQVGFSIHLLMMGVNPQQETWCIKFRERRTDTPNQRADLALKYLAAGASQTTAWETAGLDPRRETSRLNHETKQKEPYKEAIDEGEEDDDLPAKPRAGQNKVSITPGNARKSESATDVSIRS